MSTKVRFSFLFDAFSRRAFMKRLAGLTVAGGGSLAWLEACSPPPPPPPPSPTFDVFDEISKLLNSTQGIDLRVARANDSQGPALLHFQPFWTDKNVSNSMEMHTGGTIYAAYTHPLSPVWYDSNGSPAAAIDSDNPMIRAGFSGQHPFQTLKSGNVNIHNRGYYTLNLPPGRLPATRWFTIYLPPEHPCSPDTGCPQKNPSEWLSFLKSGDPRVQKLIPHQTPNLPYSGNYCFRDTYLGGFFGNPPAWMTILPVNDVFPDDGQRTYHPNLPDNDPSNFYVDWDKIMELMQTDSARALDILAWRGKPSAETYDHHRVPWLPSKVEGIVTNSFLSGDDYGNIHRNYPGDYWLGSPEPHGPVPCGRFHAQLSLCDDWIVYVEPDPEYQFLLARNDKETIYIPMKQVDGEIILIPHERQLGNFNQEHLGSMENEIEQWLVPGGYRPEPGDRISMTGRWVIDCGHDDWHAELHPYESFVTSHAQTRSGVLGGTEIVATVVVTGAWQGGALSLDIWPPARPSATATLHYSQDQPGAEFGLTVRESLSPQENHNHLTLTVQAPALTLRTYTSNDMDYRTDRRLATKYHLWWE